MNIESNNLDAVTDHSDTNEELNTDQPVTVKGPIIQIKKNIEANEEDKQCNLNNLVNNEKRKPENSKEIVGKAEHPSSSKTSKDILKLKSRRKSKENIVRVKNKFSETSLEYISSELKGVIFSGWINEREYIDNLKSYRDIVEIDEWESDLTHKLKQVMKGVRGVMEGTKWINITVPSSIAPCYCLWVLLDTAPIPGHYWMQISDITCNDPQFGLKFTLKTIREIHPFDGESKEERTKRLKGEMSPDEWKEWALSLVNFDLKNLLTSTMNLLTPSNIGQGFRLLVVLSVTIIVGLATFLQNFWIFFLRFMREFGIFVHHATPFAQSVIRFFEKIVGGIFILIAMVYKDLRQPKMPPLPPPPPRGFLNSGQLCIGSPNSLPPQTVPISFVPSNNWVFNPEDEESDS